jgi:phospholipid/cholesterol/gamma-HCH transport system permease protein
MKESPQDNLRSDNSDLNIPKMESRHDGVETFIDLSGFWNIESNQKTNLAGQWYSLLEESSEAEVFYLICADSVEWDSSLVVFLQKIIRDIQEKQKKVNLEGIPSGIRKLLELSTSKKADVGTDTSRVDEFEKFATDFPNYFIQPVEFFGAVIICFFDFISGRSSMRWRDFFESARRCGASALPIVTLISFLTGLTMAFVGSVQLEKFNAKIYVADLVSLAMVREMGALMVAIIMAGRTGASFAAEIGNMNLNEEIDSLRTFGISPISFLVLPRVLAIFLMTPLLTLYADVVGIMGGLTVGTVVMDFSAIHYLEQTQAALTHMWEVYSGVTKSLFFGLIIGLVGCYKGMHSGRDSAALGKSVTSAVVISITFIIVADALFETTFSYLELR